MITLPRLTVLMPLAVLAVAGCEPVPTGPACAPLTNGVGTVVVGCTPDGQPILATPAPAPARSVPAPAPVVTTPIGATVATGELGPVPTTISDTGEALPPAVPVTPPPVPQDQGPDVLPTTVAPPPAGLPNGTGQG